VGKERGKVKKSRALRACWRGLYVRRLSMKMFGRSR